MSKQVTRLVLTCQRAWSVQSIFPWSARLSHGEETLKRLQPKHVIRRCLHASPPWCRGGSSPPKKTTEERDRRPAKDVSSSKGESTLLLELKASVSSPEEGLERVLHLFSHTPSTRAKCSQYGIPKDVCAKALPQFCAKVLSNQLPYLPTPDLLSLIQQRLVSLEGTISLPTTGPLEDNGSKSLAALLRLCSASFLRFVQETYPQPGRQLDLLLQLNNSTAPEKWFPEARAMKRKVIMHVGPTNSGKTYSALQALMNAPSGVYCGPLRLLAHEIYDKFNTQGIACNLVTGEERRESDGVYRTSCTVEMTDLNRDVDVAVMDEIQMIADPDRGWAWTNAFLGLRASHLHVCGEPTAIPVIRALVERTGDELEIIQYERLTRLEVDQRSLGGSMRHVRPGDCIVAFSRKDIFSIKRMLERTTELRAAVIYGNLPPETRAEQAKLFNADDGPYDVLVASDAIGMGLNLNVGRIIFMSMEKWNGSHTAPLSVSQTKQIAGRAGRFNTKFSTGYVTTYYRRDVKALQTTLIRDTPEIQAAGLNPSTEQIQRMAELLPNDSLSDLLEKYEDLAIISGNAYFLCDMRSQKLIADLIQPLDLHIIDRHLFSLSPTKASDPMISTKLVQLASCRAAKQEAKIDDFIELPKLIPASSIALQQLENQHKVIILYLWLAQRMHETFVDTKKAMYLKRKCEDLIDTALQQMAFGGNKSTRQ